MASWSAFFRRECHGFDCSAWAIEHAEALARPVVHRADVADYEFDREYDLVVALDLFSHLTEAQADAFLRRARGHTRIGILATIASPGARPNGERDATHVSRHDRAWWSKLFLATGWRQDPLHRALEVVAQRQTLPARMGWELYLFSPGERVATARVAREAIA